MILHTRASTNASTYCSLWESPYKTYMYGEFLNLYGGGQQNRIFFYHQNQCTEPPLRSDMDPNMPERLLRP